MSHSGVLSPLENTEGLAALGPIHIGSTCGSGQGLLSLDQRFAHPTVTTQLRDSFMSPAFGSTRVGNPWITAH